MKSTFKILFFIRKDKINAEGKSVIYVRLTINGSACQFSTKNEVSVKIWDAKNYRATGRSEEATNINSFLDFMRKNLLEIYVELSQNNEPVTPTAIRDKFMGKVEKKNDTLLSLFAEINMILLIAVSKSSCPPSKKREIFRCARSTTISFATFTPF